MARLRQTLGGRSGGPLTHSSYTTRRDTTRRADHAEIENAVAAEVASAAPPTEEPLPIVICAVQLPATSEGLLTEILSEAREVSACPAPGTLPDNAMLPILPPPNIASWGVCPRRISLLETERSGERLDRPLAGRERPGGNPEADPGPGGF